MARLLYPHDDLGDDVYAEVLGPLLLRADRFPRFSDRLRAGIASLDSAVGGSWLRAPADRQVEALGRIEGTSFFTTIQGQVRHRLYHHPAVWPIVGYEGPSLERGGYLDRGFDRIDWLPPEVS